VLSSLLQKRIFSLQSRAALRLCARPSEHAIVSLLTFLKDMWYCDNPAMIVITPAIIETVNQSLAEPPGDDTEEILIHLVKHRDRRVKLLAAFHLTRRKSKKAAQALALLLQAPCHSPAVMAALGLGNNKDERAIPLLISLLEEKELDMLTDEGERTRERGELDYYIRLFEPPGHPDMGQSLPEKKKAMAFSLLMEMKSPESLIALACYAKEKDPATLMTILKSMLASWSPFYIPSLLDLKGKRNELGIQQALDSMLRRHYKEIPQPLLTLVQSPEKKQRALGARTWAEMKELQDPALQEKLLSDTYWPVRYWALKGLTAGLKSPSGEALEPFISALGDPSPTVRILALQTLEQRVPLKELLQKTFEDRHFSVVMETCRIAGLRKCQGVEPELIVILDHGNYAVRMMAARALGELRSKAAFPKLKPMLKQCTLPEKVWLYFALTLLTGEKKYWIFTPFLNLPDDDRPERIVTFDEGKATDREYSEDLRHELDESGFRLGPGLLRAEFDELVAGEPDALLKSVRNLHRIYVEKNSERRESLFQAIEVLGAIALPETIAMLGTIMKSDREKSIKMAVMKTLNSRGTDEAFIALVPGLADITPEIYVNTAQLLKRADPVILVPHLEALLSDGKVGTKQKELITGLLNAAMKRE
jgi:HEAT repeat protein